MSNPSDRAPHTSPSVSPRKLRSWGGRVEMAASNLYSGYKVGFCQSLCRPALACRWRQSLSSGWATSLPVSWHPTQHQIWWMAPRGRPGRPASDSLHVPVRRCRHVAVGWKIIPLKTQEQGCQVWQVWQGMATASGQRERGKNSVRTCGCWEKGHL